MVYAKQYLIGATSQTQIANDVPFENVVIVSIN